MTTPPTAPLVMSPLFPSSPVMSLLSPYLAVMLTSLPLLSIPSPSTSPPMTYSIILPVITPAGELLNTEKPTFIIFWNQVSPNLWSEAQSLIWLRTAYNQLSQPFSLAGAAYFNSKISGCNLECLTWSRWIHWKFIVKGFGTACHGAHLSLFITPARYFASDMKGSRTLPFWMSVINFFNREEPYITVRGAGLHFLSFSYE